MAGGSGWNDRAYDEPALRPVADSAANHAVAGSRRRSRLIKALLVPGFLCLTGAIATAVLSHPSGYELSVYTATPLAYWVLLGVAFCIALGVAAWAPRDRLSGVALLLGGCAALTVPSLPLLRGYQFYGKGDALYHLGFARLIRSGEMAWGELLYPGAHTLGVFLRELGGVPMTRALLYVVFAFVLVYVLFVPLTVGTLIPDRRAVLVAGFSGLLLLPLNGVSTHLTFHPFSLAVLFSPVIYYLCFTHLLRRGEDDALPTGLAATSLVFPVAMAGIVFFHPLAAVDQLLVLAGFSLVHLFVRLRRSAHPLADWRGLYGQVVILAAFVFSWSSGRDATSGTLSKFRETIRVIFFGSPQAGSEVQETSESAASIGVDLLDLFAKLFLVDVAYVLLGAGVVFWLFVAPRIGLRDTPVDRWFQNAQTATMLFVVSGIVVTPYYLIKFFGPISHHFFRHLGFSMVLVTFAGSFGLFYGLKSSDRRRLYGVFLVVFLLAGTGLSFAALHDSPYIYNNNKQTPGNTLSGFANSFVHQTPEADLRYSMPSGDLGRYEAAVGGKEGAPWYPGDPPNVQSGPTVPESALTGNVTEYFATRSFSGFRQDTYYAVMESKRQKHTISYRGLYYSEGTLTRIERHRDVHRVRTTGEFTLYYVDLPPEAGEVYRGGPALESVQQSSDGGRPQSPG